MQGRCWPDAEDGQPRPRRDAAFGKGPVKVESYANSELYKDKEELEALRPGRVQMLAPSLSNLGHLAYALIVNKKFWDGLPADIRTTLEGAIKDATVYAGAIASTDNASALEEIKARGKSTVHTATAADSAEWKKALMPVHKEMESRVGKATVDAVYKAAGFVVPK